MKNSQNLKNMKYRETSLRFPVAIAYLIFICLVVLDQISTREILMRLSTLQWILVGGGYLGIILMELYESRITARNLRIMTRILFLFLRILFLFGIFSIEPNLLPIPIFTLFIFATTYDFGPVAALVTLIVNIVFQILFIKTDTLGISDMELVAFFIFSTLLATLLIRDDRNRRHNLVLHKKLESFVATSFSQAKQEERNRISRDLHDSLGHQLVAINIQLQKAVAYREINPSESELAITQAQEAANLSIRELRQTLGSLREMDTPPTNREELQKLVDGVLANGMSLDYAIQGSDNGFSDLSLSTLRQILQECLTNVQKHAHAQNICLNINFGRKGVNLFLQDDGIGFDPNKVDESQHFGLSGLRERIDLVDGNLHISSRKNKGTTIKVFIPK